MKRCNKCFTEKPFIDFHRSRGSKDGFVNGCKSCVADYKKKYYETNSDTVRGAVKKYQDSNKADISERRRKHYEENKDAMRERGRRWSNENKEARRISGRKWYEENRDLVIERSRLWYENNKELASHRNRKWHNDNIEHAREYHRKYGREWSKANPAKKAEAWQRYRIRKQENGIYKISLKFLKKLYLSPCAYCGSTDKITMDHVIPVSRGGTHSEGNLLPACSTCNCSKGAKVLTEWRKRK